MPIPVYARLWWDAHRGHGQAVIGDVAIELHEAPHILGRPAELDYSEVHPDELCSPPEIREHDYDKRREMYPPEVLAVRAYLRGLAATVGRFLKRKA